MKNRFVMLALAPILCLTLTAQTPAPSSDKTKLEEAKVQLALKDYQLAQVAVQQSQQNLQTARAAVEAQVAQSKKELGLGSEYDFNFNTGQFEKPAKPTPAVKK